MATGLGVVAAYGLWVSREAAPWVTLPFVLGLTAVDLLRLYGGPTFRDTRVEDRLMSLVGRRDERRSFSSSFYFAWGVLGAVVLSSRETAMAAVLMLAVGDPLAGAVAILSRTAVRRLGRSHRGAARLSSRLARLLTEPVALGRLDLGKSLAGALVLWGVAWATGWVSGWEAGPAAAVAAAVAVTELVSYRPRRPHLFRLDDNLTVPLAAVLAARLAGY